MDADSSCTIEEIGEPTSRDEIAAVRDSIIAIVEAIDAGKPLGKWRARQLDRAVEILYRAEIFSLGGRGLTFKAGEDL